MASLQDMNEFDVKKDEAVIVYHAGPNRMGEVSLTIWQWEYDEALGEVWLNRKALQTSNDMAPWLQQRGKKVRKIDERPSAMR